MVSLAAPPLSEVNVPREPFQRQLPVGAVGEAAVGIFQGVSDIRAGRNLREFEGEVADIEQQNVAFNTELSALTADLESEEDKAKTAELFNEVSKLDRGLVQGKLSRSAAQTRLRSLFSQFASEHPSLVPEFQQVIGMSRLGAVGGIGGSRSSTSLQDQDPALQAVRARNEEALRLMSVLGVSRTQALQTMRTSAEQELTVAMAQQAAATGALSLQGLSAAADATGAGATFTLMNQLLDDVTNPAFDVAEFKGQIELTRAQTISGFTQTTAANAQAAADAGTPFALTVSQQDELENKINFHFDILNKIADSKDPVAATGRLVEAQKTRSAQAVIDTVNGLGSGPLFEIVKGMKAEDAITLLFDTAPRAAEAMEKGQAVFDQLAQADPTLLIGSQLVKSFPSADAYFARLGVLFMSESKDVVFPDGEVTPAMVQREGPDASSAKALLTSKWEDTDLPTFIVDAGIHVGNSHFVDNLEALLDPRAVENFKQHPDQLLRPVENLRNTRIAREISETASLLRRLPSGITVEVNTEAFAQPVQAKGGVAGRTSSFKAADFLVMSGEPTQILAEEAGPTGLPRNITPRLQARLQKKLDILNTLFAFKSQFATVEELAQEISVVIDNIEVDFGEIILPPLEEEPSGVGERIQRQFERGALGPV